MKVELLDVQVSPTLVSLAREIDALHAVIEYLMLSRRVAAVKFSVDTINKMIEDWELEHEQPFTMRVSVDSSDDMYSARMGR